MERTLWIVVVVMGLAAWFAAGGWRRAKQGAGSGWGLEMAPLAPGAIGFVACLPASAPFAAGLALGWGFLLGSLAALAAWRGRGSERPDSGLALLPAIVATGLVFLLLRDGLPQALAGVAGGWAGGLLWAGWLSGAMAGLSPAAFAGVAVVTVAQVGVLKGGFGGPVPKDLWPLIPVGVAAAATVVRLLLARGGGVLASWPGALIAVATGVAVLVGGRARSESPWELVAVGVAGMAIWPLLRAMVGRGTSRWAMGLAGLLLVAAEVTVADQAANYGVGLWALGVSLASVFLPAAGGAGALPAAAVLLAVLRTFVVPRVSALTDTGLAEQVALAALLVASLLPSALEALVVGSGKRRVGVLAAAGLLMAVPVASVVLLGYGTLPAVLLGCVVAAVLPAGRRREQTALAAVCVALVIVAVAGLIDRISDGKRSDRLRFAGAVLVLPIGLAAFASGVRREHRS
jgi:hypothetical protein